jgi:hypothetical protein
MPSAAESAGIAAPLCSLDQLTALYAVTIGSSNCLIFLAPVAHQLGTHAHVGAASIAGNEMTSTDAEEPCLVAMTAFDIAEKLTQNKVAHGTS